MVEGNGQGNGGTPPPGAGEGGERTFTQADVNRIIAERLEREQARYADYDDLKGAAEELERLRESELSEKDKLAKRIAELEEAAADREAEARALEMEVNERLIRAEVRVVAAGLGFIDPDEAWKLADLSDVAVDDAGNVENVKASLKALAKAKPHLLGVDGGGPGGSPPNKPVKKSDAAAEEKAWVEEARRRFGIRDYAKSGGSE